MKNLKKKSTLPLLIFAIQFTDIPQLNACTEMPKLPGGTGARVSSVLFQRGETKEFCLKLPKVEMPPPRPGIPSPSPFVEWQTVNKGNTSCGVLTMKIVRPNKPDVLGKDSKRRCADYGPQPGCVLTYTTGRWIAKYSLQEPCREGLDRWDLEAKWSLKP